MRRLISAVLIVAFAVLVNPTLVQAQQSTATARIVGVAKDDLGNVLPNHTVHLRDAAGKIVQTVKTAADGSFSFSGLAAAEYTVQIAAANGTIIGTSAAVTAVAGSTTTIAVTASALALSVAGAGMSTALIATLIGGAAVTATVVGVALNGSSSPSR
jgi:hypothetical protein